MPPDSPGLWPHIGWWLGLALALASASQPLAAEVSPPIDVFVGGQGGYFAYRIPAFVVSTKGTLLAFCEGRKTSLSDDGDNDLVLRRSSDGGRTWAPLQRVYEEGGDALITIGNPCAVVDPATGRIWLGMNKMNGRVLLTHSADDGATWAPVRDITAQASRPEWGWYALGPGVGVALARGPHRGRLILPANHRETKDRSGPSASHVIYSDDHGETWRLGGSAGLHTNECQLVETAPAQGAGSELLLNMRNHWARSGKRPDLALRRLVSRSTDGGLTWSEPTREEALLEPTCQASLLRYSWPGEAPAESASGKQATSKSVLLFANPASTQARDKMTVRASFDEGRTWPVSKLVDAGPSGYCCLARLAGGKIGLLYERENYRRLSLVTLELADLAP